MHILPENHSLEEILLLLLQPTLPKKHSYCEDGEPSSEEARNTDLKIIFYQWLSAYWEALWNFE